MTTPTVKHGSDGIVLSSTGALHKVDRKINKNKKLPQNSASHNNCVPFGY